MELKILLLVAFVIGINCGVSLANCPDAEYISPCTCNSFWTLVCNNIYDVEVLKQVAENMQGVDHYFRDFWITNSSLVYIPKEIIETIRTLNLNLENVTLQNMFMEPPATESLNKILLNKSRVFRGINWPALSQMTNLTSIRIDGTTILALRKTDFGEYAPPALKELTLIDTRLKKIEEGAFQNFKDLKKLYVYTGRIEKLHRNYFPVPFNVEQICFAYHKIITIPDDLFTNMPKLDDVILVGNQIATLPESAFGGNYNQIDRLYLEGNPLKCDCSLRWIVYRKPQFFNGICATPKVMHGKKLNELNPNHFFC